MYIIDLFLRKHRCNAWAILLVNETTHDTQHSHACLRKKKTFSHLMVVSCSENDRAFDILYCITFKLMDQKWLEMHASYMDFNVRLSFLICNLSDTFFVPSTFLA